MKDSETTYSGFVTILFSLLVLGFSFLSCKGPTTENLPPKAERVHAVTDLSHQFTFYADGRFYTQYLPEQNTPHKGVMNWCTLQNFDFSNANLLILLGADRRLPYTVKDKDTINSFLAEGGGVIVFGSEGATSQNKLLKSFGAEFTDSAEYPLAASDEFNQQSLESEDASVLSLDDADEWETLVLDEKSRAVMAQKKVGKGKLLATSRSLAGSHPSAKDSINKDMWEPLLRQLAAGKKVSGSSTIEPCGMHDLENIEDHGTFKLSYTDYLEPYADAMVDVYKRSLPHIEQRMGVPLSPGMARKIILLPTGGGGFSTGNSLGLAVWWGGFPEKEDSMIEFVTHESVHSWVLPFPEVWNEPIATYVGDLVLQDMGHEQEGQRRIQNTIDKALELDPEMNSYDIQGNLTGDDEVLSDGEKRDMHWGKSFWIFEQLRKDNPNIVADYFQTKREYATEDNITEYGMHNTAAVMSLAMEKNMFPWFREHGMPVSKSKAEIPL